MLGLAPLHAEDFAAARRAFPARLNAATMLGLVDRPELLALAQKFTGEGNGVAPTNYLCVSMSESEYRGAAIVGAGFW